VLPLCAGAQSKPEKLKVYCPQGQKTERLFANTDLDFSTHFAKCGEKVLVLRVHCSLAHLPVDCAHVETTDKTEEGYLLLSAFEKKPREAKQASQTPGWRQVGQGIATGMQSYGRAADPHIAWCDNHGGFRERITTSQNQTVNANVNGQQVSGTVTTYTTYVVCNDFTRFPE
jgi:hypothetical protein